jgi:hypothetical protein
MDKALETLSSLVTQFGDDEDKAALDKIRNYYQRTSLAGVICVVEPCRKNCASRGTPECRAR